eukprot:TRINITY_DN889_c0_g1_i4.p1 TRINITY_DN889_c0_g1~~TRINITY_DN889_c0_g1_i4.p1  ORF type:complete len:1883 (+),score=603.78 TRINITY_DN889_c0_g1_i4:151-5799(+)
MASPSPSDNLQGYLTRILNKLQTASSKKHKELREAARVALDIVQDSGSLLSHYNDPNYIAASPDWDSILNKLVTPLQLAAKSKASSAKLLSYTVDCFFKLISLGYIRGSVVDESNPEAPLIDTIIGIIVLIGSECADDGVQVQVAKTLCSAVELHLCEVHGEALQSSVRCCYLMHVGSKTQSKIHTEAKTALQKILNITFERLRTHVKNSSSSNGDNNNNNSNDDAKTPQAAQTPHEPSSVAAPIEIRSSISSTNPTQEDAPATATGEGEAPVPANEGSEPAALELEDISITPTVPLTASGTLPPKPFAEEEGNDSDAPDAEEESDEEKPPAAETSPAPTGSVDALVTATPPVMRAGPIIEFAAPQKTDRHTTGDNADATFEDALQLFIQLCKLSIQPPSEKNPHPESADMRSKVLSLELVLSILETSGPALRGMPRFVAEGLREHLGRLMIVNGTAPNPLPRVYKLTLSIFLHVMSYFRDHMKDHIELVFTRVMMKALDSPASSTMQQRWMVLQVMQQICKNPQTLVEIFINYDCDVNSRDVFERVVHSLAKGAQGTGVDSNKAGVANQSESQLRALSLDCVVSLLRSLADYGKDLHEATQASVAATTYTDPDDASDPAPLVDPHASSVAYFQKQKQYKQMVEQGKQKFHHSFKKGMAFFFENGVVKKDPVEVAKFFRNTEGLDKTKIGEYIGEKDDFMLAVMHEFAKMFHFGDHPIDVSLRMFLNTFRLPGEAQKIDRIINAFAKQYYEDTQGKENAEFADGDAAFVFSFSMVMLATDLHNPAVKKPMTKEQWLNNNRGINGGKNFAETFLLSIYDRIAAEPLKINDTTDHAPTAAPSPIDLASSSPTHEPSTYFQANSVYHVKDMFALVWYPVLAAFSVPMENTDDAKVVSLCLDGFQHAVRISGLFRMDLERSAFLTSLLKFTALESQQRDKDKDKDRAGGGGGSGGMMMSMGLGGAANEKMDAAFQKFKSSESIKVLLNFAFTDGNYLQESWTQLLRCVSLMERLHLLAQQEAEAKAEAQGSTKSKRIVTEIKSGEVPVTEPQAQLDNATSPPVAPPTILPQAAKTSSSNNLNNSKDINNNNNSGASSSLSTSEGESRVNVDQAFIDRIFVHSGYLSNAAIVFFAKALCDVSFEEVSLAAPTVFSLHKAVEVASSNAHRRWVTWSRIWGLLADHFARIGGLQAVEKLDIVLLTVEQMRLLALKFLDHATLTKNSFPKDLFRPFESIFAQSPHVAVREAIIRCFSQLIVARSQQVRSGWKGVFNVFTQAANLVKTDRPPTSQQTLTVTEETIVALAFDMIEEIVREYFHMIAPDYFVDCVNSLSAFANRKAAGAGTSREINLRAIDALSFCSVQLANGRVTPLVRVESLPVDSSMPASPSRLQKSSSSVIPPPPPAVFTDSEKHLSLWFPLLTGLSRVVGHKDQELRTSALDTLFRTLALFGALFSPRLWALVFRGVVLPLFDHVGYGQRKRKPAQSAAHIAGSLELLKNSYQYQPSEDDEALAEDNEWLVTTCPGAFRHLVEMYGSFLDTLPFLLDDILDLFVCCIVQGNEVLARTAISHMQHLLIVHGIKLTETMWTLVCSQISNAIKSLIPKELVDLLQATFTQPAHPAHDTPPSSVPPQVATANSTTPSPSVPRRTSTTQPKPTPVPTPTSSLSSSDSGSTLQPFKRVRVKCNTQLLLIQATNEITLSQYSCLQTSHLLMLTSSLEAIYNWSYSMSIRVYLQDTLAKINMADLIKKMELASIGSYLRIMFRMYAENPGDRRTQAELRLIRRCYDITAEYAKATDAPTPATANKLTIVVQILQGYHAFDEEQFNKHLGVFYPLFAQLMLNDSRDIRAVLRDIVVRVGSTRNYSSPLPPARRQSLTTSDPTATTVA